MDAGSSLCNILKDVVFPLLLPFPKPEDPSYNPFKGPRGPY